MRLRPEQGGVFRLCGAQHDHTVRVFCYKRCQRGAYSVTALPWWQKIQAECQFMQYDRRQPQVALIGQKGYDPGVRRPFG